MAKRKTNEEFVTEVKNKYPNNEYEVVGKYIDCKTPIMIKHTSCGSKYLIKPTLLLGGITCTKCNIKSNSRNKKTQEQFDKEVFDLYNEEYTFLEPYINARTKLLCKHNVCGHEWMVSPQSFLNKSSHCPMCASNRRKTNSEFLKEVFEIVGDEYTFLEEYIDSSTKLKVRHNVCGRIYEITPNMFLSRKCQCLCCAYMDINKKSNEQFLIDLFDVWGNEYTPLEEYKGALTKIWFIHNKCGRKLYAIPNMLLRGSGCRPCGIQSFADKMRSNTEEYKEKIKNKFGNSFEVVCEYVNSNTKIKIKCNDCNKVFSVLPSSFLLYNQCPRCSQSNAEKIIDKYLTKNNILFTSQKTYVDLRGVKGRMLKFDFHISKNNLLIEYQGQFHDGTVPYQKKEQLEIQQEHDKRKRNYCRKNNIPLLEIWYWDFKKIEEILDRELGQLIAVA